MMGERKLTKEEIDRVRGIEGFPIAKDEDIIALSRPPYYTACPTPFIADFIKEHGTPYDESTDDYHCEPFAADVSEGKNDPIYMAHSYHTKVPYKAIMRYILHYTKPGDVVFDGFCGTGMTGVAAQMCGCPDAEFKYLVEKEYPDTQWGARHALLTDLSPAATFFAYNYNNSGDINNFASQAEQILNDCINECAWVYKTRHVDANGTPITNHSGKNIFGNINYTAWSDVLVCPTCSNEIIYWDAVVDPNTWKVTEIFTCPKCGSTLKKADCEKSKEAVYDEITHDSYFVIKRIPVLISYFVGKKRFSKKPDEYDLETIQRINNSRISQWYPSSLMMGKGENWGDSWRSGSHYGVTRVDQFYTKRNLYVLSLLRDKCKSDRLLFWFTSCLPKLTIMNRFMPQHGSRALVGPMAGTMYISSLWVENNVFSQFEFQLQKMIKSGFQSANSTTISTQSVTKVSSIPNNSIDYIFTDPPFGSNLNYSELSYFWESWIRIVTNNANEAIVNSSQAKGISEYKELMVQAFKEYYRVLKPKHWITVEFHNSQNAVWNAIQEAISEAGFVVASVKVLDKQKGTIQQLINFSSVKQDLVISAYKPQASFVKKFTESSGDPEMVWEFVRQHLQNATKVSDSSGIIEVVTERQDYLLFDRMVAFHIINGIPVPMDSHSFYTGLRERFIQRDGMFFLADQVNEYDERRQKMELQDQQLSLFVSDEKSAIMWLNVQLTQARQSYSDIQPKYLQELHQAKFEQMPELLDMLKENFLQDDDGKWYVPNLSDKADLERLRRKRLIKDFYDIYVKGTGRIKNARTEAIRVGFDECWKERNYSLIVKVGDRLPETVLQEDPALLMYYDNAASRM